MTTLTSSSFHSDQTESDSCLGNDLEHAIVHATQEHTSVAHHARFYMEDEMVIFRVTDSDGGGRLFKVHRYFLKRDSEVFRDMFACPSEYAGEEGRSEETAISLPGVTVRELDCLLSFLYDGMYERTVTLDNWVELLSISSRFLFEKIRERAIKEITQHVPPLDPIARVHLAMKHDVPQWLTPAYAEFCVRPTPLTDEEAERLGLPTVVRLARMREEFLRMRFRASESAPVQNFRDTSTGCGCKSCRKARQCLAEEALDLAAATKIVENTLLDI